MAHQEVAAVDLLRFDELRSPRFDAELLADVVAALARRLRMAALAKLWLLSGRGAVATRELGVVAHEGLGQSPR